MNNRTWIVSYSPRKTKKYMAEGPNGIVVHFGAKDMSDYLQHKDPIRKKAYVRRMEKVGNWHDIRTPAFWSRWFSWSYPEVDEVIDFMERTFNIKVIDNL